MFRRRNAHKATLKEACECCMCTFALSKTTFLDFTCVVSEQSGLVDCLLLASRVYKFFFKKIKGVVSLLNIQSICFGWIRDRENRISYCAAPHVYLTGLFTMTFRYNPEYIKTPCKSNRMTQNLIQVYKSSLKKLSYLCYHSQCTCTE